MVGKERTLYLFAYRQCCYLSRMPATAAQLVLSTCPDRDTAERLARMLVERRLAACVNIVPGLLSVYRWQGEVQRDEEHLLLIKTDRARYPALETALRAAHPYELPEIVAVTISNGSTDYLRWITSELETSS